MGKKRVLEKDQSDLQEESYEEEAKPSQKSLNAPQKVAKISKPLPEGYKCKICGVEDHHAAYDCPHKVKKFEKPAKVAKTAENTDTTTAKQTTSNDDSTSTNMSVFISGLPYDLNRETLLKFLLDEGCDPEMVKKDIKLVMFEDNSKKCKGLAYVKCHTEEQLAKCIAINGKKFGPLNLSIERVESNRPKANKTNHKNVVQVHGANAKRCFRCGMHHDPATCSNPRICYRCKSTEHLSNACPMKKN